MELATLRRKRGLSQEALANVLGLKSKGHISDIERADSGRRPSLQLALKIEKWSDGLIRAESLNPIGVELVSSRPRKRSIQDQAA